MFLYYYLFKSLVAGNQIVVQIEHDFLIVMHNGIAHQFPCLPTASMLELQSTFDANFKSEATQGPIVALVVSSEGNCTPAAFLTYGTSPFYVIQASSPHPSRWEGWSERRSARCVVMEPWNWEEIYIGA